MRNETVHVAVHAALLGAALLFWRPVLGADPIRRLAPLAQVGLPARGDAGKRRRRRVAGGVGRRPLPGNRDDRPRRPGAAGAIMLAGSFVLGGGGAAMRVAVGEARRAARSHLGADAVSGRRRAPAAAVGACLLAGVLVLLVAPGAGLGQGDGPAERRRAPAGLAARGRALYLAGCSSCHGYEANGIHGVAPSLHGVGALAADFYLSTGRMPLQSPADEPTRTKPAVHARRDRGARRLRRIVRRPADPAGVAAPERRSRTASRSSWTAAPAATRRPARGGIVPGAFAPALHQCDPAQIAGGGADRAVPDAAVRPGPSDRRTARVDRAICRLRHARRPTAAAGASATSAPCPRAWSSGSWPSRSCCSWPG